MASAHKEWDYIDGFCLGHGIDLETLPLNRFCHVMWWILTRNAEDAGSTEKLKRDLWLPPKGVEVTDPRSPWATSRRASGPLSRPSGCDRTYRTRLCGRYHGLRQESGRDAARSTYERGG